MKHSLLLTFTSAFLIAAAVAAAAALGPQLRHAAAGAMAGAISRLVVGPLDLVKIRLQVQREPVSKQTSHYTGFLHAFSTIVAEEGLRGLWAGTETGLLMTIPYTAVQFVVLHRLKDMAAWLGWGGSSTAVAFTRGALAAAVATVAAYPLDLLRTTLAAQGEPKVCGQAVMESDTRVVQALHPPIPRQVYRSMPHAAACIVQSQGLPGLYRGLGVTLIGIMPHAALQFGFYDLLSGAWEASAAWAQHAAQQAQPPRWPLPAVSAAGLGAVLQDRKLQAFVCGLTAGLLAKLGSHPLDVAKKRYQVAGLARSLRYGARVEQRQIAMPLLVCLSHIYQTEGVAGLWKGTVPSCLKAAPEAAITFAVHDAVIALLS